MGPKGGGSGPSGPCHQSGGPIGAAICNGSDAEVEFRVAVALCETLGPAWVPAKRHGYQKEPGPACATHANTLPVCGTHAQEQHDVDTPVRRSSPYVALRGLHGRGVQSQRASSMRATNRAVRSGDHLSTFPRLCCPRPGAVAAANRKDSMTNSFRCVLIIKHFDTINPLGCATLSPVK